MSAVHTPGPWGVISDPDSPRERAMRITSYYAIAPLAGPAHVILPAGRADVQGANAYLIAAAPDLLEALRAVLPLLPEPMYHEREVASARAALARAEGRAS